MLSSILLIKFLFFSDIEENKNYINLILNKQSIYNTNEEKNLLSIKKIILEKYLIKNIDFLSDSWINKFVNNKVHFNNLSYEPNDLENINWNYLLDSKWDSKIRKEAGIELKNMSKDFYDNFEEKISVVSAYRSYFYQVWIKNWWCPDNFCAKAWYSEHQTWLAIDLFEASNKESWKNSKKLQKYYNWLDENAHKYWFINTYKKWIEIDWYEVEPWHWRYIWIKLATYLKENNMTFAELFHK